MNIDSKITVMIPYHFRENVEQTRRKHLVKSNKLESNYPLFDVTQEPNTLTLIRAWSQRRIPVFKQMNQIPEQAYSYEAVLEAKVALEQVPMNVEGASAEIRRIKDRYLKNIRPEDIDVLDFGPIEDQKAKIHRLFDNLKKAHLKESEPLWETLDQVDVEGLQQPSLKQGQAQQQQLISRMRTLINNDKRLNTHMSGSGMSASLKRLWNVETDVGKANREVEDQTHHPISGRCIVLIATESLYSLWGLDQTFEVVNRNNEVAGEVKLERIINVFLNKNNGYICITFALQHIDTLSNVQDLVHSLTRDKQFFVRPKQATEWRDWHHDLMPADLRGAGKKRDGFSLKSLVHWLTAISPNEANGQLEVARTGDLRKWIHHTSVYIDKSLDEEHDLTWTREECWKLSRAVGTTRMSPIRVSQGESRGGTHLYDDTLVETSVEGTCALTWKSETATFNRKDWAMKEFHALYLILHLHIRGEEAGLQDFSYESLKLIRNLRPLTNHQSDDFEAALKRHVKKLKMLILDMVYFNISFNSASSGGYSDHMSFLRELREVHSLETLREELKTNITELSELVERLETEARDEKESEFNRYLGILGAVAVPFGLISGLLGMNNFEGGDLQPIGIGFYGVLVITTIISTVMGVLIFRKFR